MKTLNPLTFIWRLLSLLLQVIGAVISVVILAVAFIASLIIVRFVHERYLITQIAGMCIGFVWLIMVPEKFW